MRWRLAEKGEPTLFEQPIPLRRDSFADFDPEKTVCFTGHRVIAAEKLPALRRDLDLVLEKLWQRGYNRFVAGGALGFDTLAAQAVITLALRHDDVKLGLILPCTTQTRGWPQEAVDEYLRLLYLADSVQVLSAYYYNGCMMVRNRALVDHASFCVCLYDGRSGGTAHAVGCAVRAGLPVLNLAMQSEVNAFVENH